MSRQAILPRTDHPAGTDRPPPAHHRNFPITHFRNPLSLRACPRPAMRFVSHDFRFYLARAAFGQRRPVPACYSRQLPQPLRSGVARQLLAPQCWPGITPQIQNLESSFTFSLQQPPPNPDLTFLPHPQHRSSSPLFKCSAGLPLPSRGEYLHIVLPHSECHNCRFLGIFALKFCFAFWGTTPY